jgi:hypothetical protein
VQLLSRFPALRFSDVRQAQEKLRMLTQSPKPAKRSGVQLWAVCFGVLLSSRVKFLTQVDHAKDHQDQGQHNQNPG